MLYSFSTTAFKSAEQPTPDRPQIGASSLFDNVKFEAEEKLAKQENKVMDKEVSLWKTDNNDRMCLIDNVNLLVSILFH